MGLRNWDTVLYIYKLYIYPAEAIFQRILGISNIPEAIEY